jgi:dihydroorotate dehydrogenase electron transfer subunit
MKKIIEAEILGHKEIADGIFRITLQADGPAAAAPAEDAEPEAAVIPGQFVNVYLRDKSLLLPRPISICRADRDRIILVYRVVGKGTKELSEYRTGETVRISTPLGNGYDLEAVFNAMKDAGPEPGTVALVAGGLGVPPMVELAKAIRSGAGRDSGRNNLNGQIRLIAAVGFQDKPFLVAELNSFCNDVFIASEKGAAGFRGNVLEMMEKQGLAADYYLSCGPKPMLTALARYCAGIGKPLQVSLEERMGCGYGACVGCTCKTREDKDGSVKQKKVCLDGPVFFREEVIWDD